MDFDEKKLYDKVLWRMKIYEALTKNLHFTDEDRESFLAHIKGITLLMDKYKITQLELEI